MLGKEEKIFKEFLFVNLFQRIVKCLTNGLIDIWNCWSIATLQTSQKLKILFRYDETHFLALNQVKNIVNDQNNRFVTFRKSSLYQGGNPTLSRVAIKTDRSEADFIIIIYRMIILSLPPLAFCKPLNGHSSLLSHDN